MKTELAKGLTISRVITGLWQIADMERGGTALDPVKTSRHMEPYVEAGLTTFDMADHYGSSEIIAGTFRSGLEDKSKVQLFTKWVPQPGKIGRDEVRRAVETALDRMQDSSLDLLQFHAWHYPDPSWLEGLFYLNELKEEGMIRHLGVTNFDSAHLRMAVASGIPIVSNQVCHSLLDRRAAGKMTAVCKEYDVKLMAFGTLAGGFLTDKWLGKPEPAYDELSTWSQMKYKRFIDAVGGWEPFQHLLRTARGVADKHGASIASIATRFILENEAVAGVIVGARLGESEHIRENRNMLDITLDRHDIETLRSAQDGLREIPGDCGVEYRKPPFLTASGDLSHHLEKIPKAFTPVKAGKNREQIFSGTEWESYAGYCRAVRIGNHIHVSGTTATLGKRMIGGKDPAAQTHFVIDKIEGVITSFGGTLADVVRTRIFVNRIDDWEPIARAHGERFKDINPANALVASTLVGDGYLVEIEAEAVIRAT